MKKLFLMLGIISLPTFAAVSANVSFTSDYIWRGMTQSDAPAIQGGFDYANDSGFYAGLVQKKDVSEIVTKNLGIKCI